MAVRRLSMLRNDRVRATYDVLRLPDVRRIELGWALRSPASPRARSRSLLGFARGPYWPYLMFGVIGVANLFDDVGVYSSLQQVIPPRLMGRALGVRRGLLLLSMGLGSAVTPLLIGAWGARGTLIATGLLLVVLAAAFLPRLTAIDARISAPGPDLALLRQVSFFRPLPFAIVEHLASELQSATCEPGDVSSGKGSTASASTSSQRARRAPPRTARS